MRIDIPYVHEARVVPACRRAPVATARMGKVTVDVAEASSADCPVAIRWRRSARDGDRVVRAHDGRLFEPWFEGVAVPTLTAARRGFLSDAAAGRLPTRLAVAFPHLSVDAPTGVEGRTMSDDSEGRRAEAARTYCEALLLVDGDLWWSHPAVEPVWRVRTAGPYPEVVLEGGPVRWNEAPFSADRRADVDLLLAHRLPHRPVARADLRGADAAVEAWAPLMDDVVHQAAALPDAAHWTAADDSHEGPPTVSVADRRPWKPDLRLPPDVAAMTRRVLDAARAGAPDPATAARAISTVCDLVAGTSYDLPREWRQTRLFVGRVRPNVRRWLELEAPLRRAAVEGPEEELSGLRL